MSAPMKKHPTKIKLKDNVGRLYLIPKSVAQQYRAPDDSIAADKFFAAYEKKYTKPGMLLRCLRIREGYTQEEFAQLINISQANLSKMELGKRPIGKEMAKRIAKAFDINYRSLL